MKRAVVLPANLVIGQRHFVRLTPTHQLVLVVIIRKVHVDVFKRRKDKRLGVNHPNVKVNGTDERLENILEDILIRVPDGATPDQVKAAENKAKAAIVRANKGEDFSKLAGELSEEPGASQRGGDLGYFPKDKMVPSYHESD